jgi:hypothetical protein
MMMRPYWRKHRSESPLPRFWGPCSWSLRFFLTTSAAPSIAVIVGLAGCSLLTNPSAPQCETATDCSRFGRYWRCEQQLCIPPPGPENVEELACLGHQPPPTSKPRLFRFAFTSVSDGQRVDGVSARVCALTDFDCRQPLSQLTDDGSGGIEVSVAGNTEIYIEFRKEGFVPTVVSLGKHALPSSFSSPIELQTESALHFILAIANVPFDARLGIVGFWIMGCTQQPLAGATVHIPSLQGTMNLQYLNPETPDKDLTVTAEHGRASLFAVEPQLFHIEVFWGEFYVAQAPVVVKSGFSSVIRTGPTR